MGCVKVKITPIGGISCKAERVGRMDVTASRVGGIHCRVFRTCSPNIKAPYLEIEPTVVWVIAGQTQNDVYSNTYWNIN